MLSLYRLRNYRFVTTNTTKLRVILVLVKARQSQTDILTSPHRPSRLRLRQIFDHNHETFDVQILLTLRKYILYECCAMLSYLWTMSMFCCTYMCFLKFKELKVLFIFTDLTSKYWHWFCLPKKIIQLQEKSAVNKNLLRLHLLCSFSELYIKFV